MDIDQGVGAHTLQEPYIRAQSLFCLAMMAATVDADYGFHGFVFPAHSERLSFAHS
jgi:hypothetical protein